MEWRITGVRRWLPPLLLVGALVVVGTRVANVADPTVATIGDYVVLGVAVLIAVVAAVWTATLWRTRVVLTPVGVDVRGLRRRLVPYVRITRVYRDRLANSVVTLLLSDARSVHLPAPVAGLGVAGGEVDQAVEQIRARLAPSGKIGKDPAA